MWWEIQHEQIILIVDMIYGSWENPMILIFDVISFKKKGCTQITLHSQLFPCNTLQEYPPLPPLRTNTADIGALKMLDWLHPKYSFFLLWIRWLPEASQIGNPSLLSSSKVVFISRTASFPFVPQDFTFSPFDFKSAVGVKLKVIVMHRN